MAKLVSLFISRRQQAIIAIVFGSLVFITLIVLASLVAMSQVRSKMADETRLVLAPYAQIRSNLISTFAALETQVTAAPCSAEFQEQLRRVAFLPDGFHEFLYVVDGTARCSATAGWLSTPLRLGEPDKRGERETAAWYDRDLSFSGLDGLTGSIILKGPFAIVVPRSDTLLSLPEWMGIEVVTVGSNGRTWHLAGSEGLYEHNQMALANGVSWLSGIIPDVQCTRGEMVCVATTASLYGLGERGMLYIISALVFAGLLAVALALQARTLIMRYWTFDARFRRHLDRDTVVCAYQPIMELATGRITGCEVLARWRDVDDSIVAPYRFIPLIERHGLTLPFTRMVVEKAHRELTETLPVGAPMTVTFNIFPRDLDSAVLCEIFQPFLAARDRFRVVIELVESDAIVVEEAQREIEKLRDAGILTYIDDFGTGYSNIQNLAALSVEGVKLDRAFAMAPVDSVMARMLHHAVEMIHSSGRVMVVEGIETAERLEELRLLRPAIDYVQGYHISRPLDVRAFAAFLVARVNANERLGLAA